MVANGEQLLRMQFLYQAAELLNTEQQGNNKAAVARHYVSEAKNIAKRHVLRVDPAIKHRYCIRCNSTIFKGPKKQTQKKYKKATLTKGKSECSFCLY